MVQQLRARAALAGDPGSIASTNLVGSQPSIIPVAGADLFGHQACMWVHIHTQKQHTHKIK